MISRYISLIYFLCLMPCLVRSEMNETVSWDFNFANSSNQSKCINVTSQLIYSDQLGYGFEKSSPIKFINRMSGDNDIRNFITSDKPFFFSVKVPEGNYLVSVTLGDTEGQSLTTIKAEVRRLMIERLPTSYGKSQTSNFLVNVRSYHINNQDNVRLKIREKTTEYWNWDNKLTLEFNGPKPCISHLKITKVDKIPTIYLAGDSTVCDQPLEPFASWGQMLPRFFKPIISIANHAESGESLRSFINEKRLAKLNMLLKSGDYLFIQMGHNDQKEKGPNVGAFSTYKKSLEQFILLARSHQTTPVLVTPMNRRTFDSNGKVINTLLDYSDAVRLVAKEQKTALIDLNAMSKILYERLGPEKTKNLFPTIHGQVEGTHHNNFGSYELAKCIIQGIRDNHLLLSDALLDNLSQFNPANPDNYDTFVFDQSPFISDEKPYGN